MNQVIATFAVIAVSLVAANPRLIGHRAVFEHFSDERFIEPRSNINKDILDFIALIPKEKIEEIAQKYIATDAEVASDYAFLISPGVQEQGLAIENSPEVTKVINQLSGVGVDTKQFINMFHDLIGWGHVYRNGPREGTGLRGCLDEIKTTIPMKKIEALAVRKYLLSAAFRKLVKVALSAEFKSNVAAIFQNGQVLSLIKEAQENGVDLEAIIEFIESLSPLYYNLKLEDGLFF